MDDLIELIEHAWNTNTKEAEQVLHKFIHAFGMEGAEKHLNLNAPLCSVCDVSPYNYLELCGVIERVVNTVNVGHTYFAIGIRYLIMANRYAT